MILFQAVPFLKSVVGRAKESDVSFLSGSIAFFAFVSIIPAMLLVLAVGSFVGGEAFAERVVSLVEDFLSEEGNQILAEALEDSAGLAGASVASSVVLLWSALKVFRAIDVAFNRVYQVDVTSSLIEELRDGLITLLAIGAGVALLVAVQLLVSWLALDRALHSTLLGLLIILPGLALILAPLYYVMPPRQVSLREILPGTLTAVIGLLLLQQLFGVYAANADQYQAYGFVGAVLLFLLWLYFGAMILLAGALVNAALGEQRRENKSEGNDETA